MPNVPNGNSAIVLFDSEFDNQRRDDQLAKSTAGIAAFSGGIFTEYLVDFITSSSN